MNTSSIARSLKVGYRGARRQREDRALSVQRVKILPILNSVEPPVPYDDDAVFQRLQESYPSFDVYLYDPYNKWKRGLERAIGILERTKFRLPGAKALEIGCGDGMMGYAMSSFGHEVTLCDARDWRDPRAHEIEFIEADACDILPIADGVFDLAVSYNTFEHLSDPSLTLREMIRTCKPGGQIYLDFGPLFASSRGMHAYRTIHMPFPQYLYSAAYLKAKLKDVGIRDLGEERDALQPMNEWRLNQFLDLWNESGCKIEYLRLRTDYSDLDFIRRFPKAFTGRGLTFEDVTTDGIEVLLSKK